MYALYIILIFDAFTDRSPFCDEVGAYLQNDMKNNPNISVITLGNYEDLDQYEFMSFSYNLDGKHNKIIMLHITSNFTYWSRCYIVNCTNL